jgi:hypothetical protein
VAEAAISLWIPIRIVALAVAFLSATSFVRSLPGDFSHPSWPFFGEMIGIVALGVVFVLGLQKINPMSTASWRLPRWSDNPFSLRQPLPNFHFSAWLFIALGLGSVVVGLVKSPHNWAWEIPLGIGVGAWIGVRIMSDPASSEEKNVA